jgi:DNA primase small subunit
MTNISQAYVHRAFHEYYSTAFSVPPLTEFTQREFGYFIINSKRMIRHKSFNNPEELRLFFSKNTPSDVYRSGAYYELPEAEMSHKGWLGADLIFDIDADHISTSCDKLHDIWTCGECGYGGHGVFPDSCPSCKKKKVKINTWPCKYCLDSAKEETKKLIIFLKNDFGFPDEELHLFFSGHRGYHIHVENNIIKNIDTIARKEISDYITGLGIELFINKKRNSLRDFHLSDFGWQKRLKNGLQNFLSTATNDDLKMAGIIMSKKRSSLIAEKELIITRCVQKGMWEGIQELTAINLKKLFLHVINLESSQIDTVVTTDTHRLIRMNNTLHGKTGLKKVEFSIENIDSFDPFKEAVAFNGGTVKVLVTDAPSFALGDKMFGPYENQVTELPTAAAVLLICKERAKLV